jgi:opacity protein-like surface antigen
VAEAGGLAGDLLGADPADVTDVVDGISTSLNSYTLAANIIYDFRRGSKINPYLGVGTGVQFVGFNAQESDSGAELTVDYPTVIYQWMAGVSSPLSQNSEVFVEYRGLGTFGTNASASLGNDSVSVGTSLYQGSVFAGFRRDF